MSSRNFDTWFATFQNTNRTFSYWVDYEKVVENANKVKVELCILNSLLGSKNIKRDFVNIVNKYPECLQCIPLLLAVRGTEIVQVEDVWDFSKEFACTNFNSDKDRYIMFLEKVGLFDFLKDRHVNDLFDYVVGIEVGLDSNARKNRSGDLMTDIVCDFLDSNGIKYDKEVTTHLIKEQYKIDLSPITNNWKTRKKFDFVVKKNKTVFGTEVNFYSTSGSKLNETARSYKEITLGSKHIPNFKFVWITDGAGWEGAKNNLKETFDVLDELYNIADLKRGELAKLLRDNPIITSKQTINHRQYVFLG